MTKFGSSAGYTQTSRWKAILFLSVTLLGVLALSIGLRDLQLKSGMPLPDLVASLVNTDELGNLPGSEALLRIIRGIWLFALIAFPFAAVYVVLSPSARRQMLKTLLRILPFLVVVYIITLIAFWNRDIPYSITPPESSALVKPAITPTPVYSESTLPG